MKRLRVILILASVFVFLVILVLGWLNYFYLPKKAKALVIRELETQTGLKAELSRLSINPFRGVTLESLELYDPDNEKTRFRVHRVYLQHLWVPLLFKKQFIASSILFEKPSFAVVRSADGQWNFQKLLERKRQGPQGAAFIPKIAVVGGDLWVTDQASPVPFSKHITQLEAKAALKLPASLQFRGRFGLEGSPAVVSFQGTRSLRGENWLLRSNMTKFSLTDLSPYAERLPFLKKLSGDLSFDAEADGKGAIKFRKIAFSGNTAFASGGLKGEADVRLSGRASYQPDVEEALSYDVNANFSEGNFQFPFLDKPLAGASGELGLTNQELRLNQVKGTLGELPILLHGKVTSLKTPELDLSLSAQTDVQTLLRSLGKENVIQPVSIEGSLELTCRIQGKAETPVLSGSLEIKDVSARKLPFFEEILHFRGPMTFTGTLLETTALTGQYQNAPFQLKGTLTDFQNPSLDVRLHFTQSLKKLETLPVFESLPANARVSLDGKSEWDLAVRGPLKKLSQEHTSGTIRLEEASAKIPLLPSAAGNINGKLAFDADTITAKDVAGLYQGDSYFLNGTFRPGQNPSASFTLKTEAFQVTSNVTLRGKDLYPFKFTRQTPKSFLTVEGEVLNYENPTVTLKGRWEGPLGELTKLGVLGKEFPTEDLKGDLMTAFALSGTPRDPQTISLQGDLASPLLTYKTMEFRNLESRYLYHWQTVTLSRFSGDFCGGRLSGDATFGFSEGKPYKFAIELSGAGLIQMIQYFSSDQPGAHGLLSGALQMEGSASDAGTFSGGGWVKVEEGNLFELAILSKLTPVLRPLVASIYPGLEEMLVFNEGYAHFNVKNNTISTNNLTLKGDRASLYGQGTLGFDQSLDFHIWMQFTDPAILVRSGELSRLKNILIDETGMLSGEVRVTGTLKTPKYHYTPLPFNRLKNFLGETGKGLLEKLFE
ncbi:MAG: AsmA-like C-terminal domain-containing protein [Candidatus Omnitrophota bacterium]